MINTDVILNKRVFKHESHRAGAKQWVLCRVNPPRGALDPAVPLIVCRSSAQALSGPSPGPRASALGRSEACATGGTVLGGPTLTLTQQLVLSGRPNPNPTAGAVLGGLTLTLTLTLTQQVVLCRVA